MLDEREFGLEGVFMGGKLIFSAYKHNLSLLFLLIEVHTLKKYLLYPHYVPTTFSILFNSYSISPKQLYLSLLYG